ncbi:guanine nucleotide-binding protein G(o) subunit alpha-like isoform X1 [Convolutriloba macropyga]|uniref:guanine nucleotide-binding protein G(o) subunit alpha-like isoform X1 n=1 Tax=Convolutriloba macropyga TaxID=536237 RepID=UPI003F51C5B0
MGASLCCPPADEETRINNQIDMQLKHDAKLTESEEKLLLLGAGECGKSTVVKQMKVIYADGFDQREIAQYRCVVRDNCMRAITAILQAMKNLGILFENEDLEDKYTIIRDFQLNFDPKTENIPPDIVSAISAVWKDPGLQSCYSRSNEYQLIDAAKYFIEKVDEITKDNYVPSKDDIIRARLQTQGIVEIEINIRTKNHIGRFRIIDVGGQRNQRKKWVHAFEDVTALIYVASLNDYDLVLQEDTRKGTNRMVESLNLFENTIHMNVFKEKSVILFLNKTDLFREKIVRSPIESYFNDYTGGPDYRKGTEYFTNLFMSKNLIESRNIYPHLTCATDTEALAYLINAVADTIIQENLKIVGVQ